MSADPALERARAGDVGAFVDLARRHDPELRGLAGEEVRLRAYLDAYRELPALAEGADVADWLAGLIRRASADEQSQEDEGNMWERLADGLASEAPALTPPALPDRRFPVIPRLQRRRR